MNKLSQTWQRVPDWLKGAGLGALTYVIPLVLWQIVEIVHPASWHWYNLNTWEKVMYALYIAIEFPWWFLWLILVPETVTDVLRSVASISVPLVWALLGALFSKIWGFRRGCVVLFVLETIVIVVCGACTFGFFEWLAQF